MEYVFKLTQQEVQILGGALGVRPFNEVAALIQKLDKQLSEQQKQVTKETCVDGLTT
jgi:hypothetical protein